MTIIVGEALTSPGKIGYKNLFEETGVTVTASTEEAGFEKENVFDGFGYDWWKPTATGDSWVKATFASTQVANYAAIWGHDLSDHTSSVKIQYSTDDIAWTDIDTAAPSNNNTLFFTWDDITAKYWRVLVSNATTIASIAGIQIGQSLDFPRGMKAGFAPPSMAPMAELKTARSESGVFLGGTKLSEGIEGSFSLDILDPAWVRTYWQPFIAHAQTPKPFVFSWDNVNHSTEVVLAWVTNKVQTPSYSDSLYMQVSLTFEGTL